MGWEGYSQNFCENGHFFEMSVDVYDCDPLPKCSCSASITFRNVVDDTNCDARGVIPSSVLDTLLISEPKTETCNLGHVHMTEPAVYRIPTVEELHTLQHYWDGKKYLPLNRRR